MFKFKGRKKNESILLKIPTYRSNHHKVILKDYPVEQIFQNVYLIIDVLTQHLLGFPDSQYMVLHYLSIHSEVLTAIIKRQGQNMDFTSWSTTSPASTTYETNKGPKWVLIWGLCGFPIWDPVSFCKRFSDGTNMVCQYG